jgi:hypothetical protein
MGCLLELTGQCNVLDAVALAADTATAAGKIVPFQFLDCKRVAGLDMMRPSPSRA